MVNTRRTQYGAYSTSINAVPARFAARRPLPGPQTGNVIIQNILHNGLGPIIRMRILESIVRNCVAFGAKFLIRARQEDNQNTAYRWGHLPCTCIELTSIPDQVQPVGTWQLNPRKFVEYNDVLYWEFVDTIVRTQELYFEDMKSLWMFCQHIKKCPLTGIFGNRNAQSMLESVWSLTLRKISGPFTLSCLSDRGAGLVTFPNVVVFAIYFCPNCCETTMDPAIRDAWNRLNPMCNQYHVRRDLPRPPPPVFPFEPPAASTVAPTAAGAVFGFSNNYAQSYWALEDGVQGQPSACCPHGNWVGPQGHVHLRTWPWNIGYQRWSP